MGGLTRDERDPQVFEVDWNALRAGRNPWKRGQRTAVDPFLIAKAVKSVMRECPHRTATGSPLVWNDYAVFMDFAEAEKLAPPDPNEMTVRVGRPTARTLTDAPTQRVSEFAADGTRLRVQW